MEAEKAKEAKEAQEAKGILKPLRVVESVLEAL